MDKINVLDHGYVAITEPVAGSDLTIVNSARVSYDKRSEELTKRDEGLINFLAREGHTSPFRHATIQFEIYAPLMIARQWWKYVAGGDHTVDAWNESSRRYITEEATFYVPMENEWRSAPENSKQGSGAPLDDMTGLYLTERMMNHIRDSESLYEEMMERGVCAELARLALPAYGMYVRWVWLGSVQSIAHLINQRTKDDAQKEFQDYAHAVKELADKYFPLSIKALTEAK
jgi:thymidylate synthase (FAD)